MIRAIVHSRFNSLVAFELTYSISYVPPGWMMVESCPESNAALIYGVRKSFFPESTDAKNHLTVLSKMFEKSGQHFFKKLDQLIALYP